ncbi:MAG TPA: anti-sigma factor [Gammaproteobacteria bacterium]|nr:anti-sigma factor [Gammaproteobacteria bacterium]
MTCQELEALLHPYLDGELTPDQRRDVETHLPGCADCRARLKDWRALHTALQAPELRFKASDTLRQRLHGELDKADARRSRERWPLWAAAAAVAVVSVGLLSWTLLPAAGGDEDDAMVDAAVAQQQQAVSAKHLTDLASSDPAAIQAFFKGKLAYVPPVHDFAAEGYALVGARLDKVKDEPAAALTYRHGADYVTVFVCPAEKHRDTGLDTDTQDDYHVVYWTRGGLSFWTVSELGADDLKRFGDLVRAAG